VLAGELSARAVLAGIRASCARVYPRSRWPGRPGTRINAGTFSDMLFSDGLDTRLTLLDAKTFASGVVILSYRPS
jgi:hypothetical protein